ncbi:MAG: RES domain-containing protein [Pirellulales bacterium]|nr:RES domain-containing protein [Pirellulales bacterium]
MKRVPLPLAGKIGFVGTTSNAPIVLKCYRNTQVESSRELLTTSFVWLGMSNARKEHPDTNALRRGIKRCLAHAVPFSGTMCRAVATKYANRGDLLTGAGAKIHGGRWNPPGLFCAIYGTLDPYAALAETLGIMDNTAYLTSSGCP